MIIIIDGYNVLKTVFQKTMISEKERTAFLALLGRYSKKRNHKIIVVFDAGPDYYKTEHKEHGITVWFSGQLSIADALIMDYIKNNKQKDLLVVTADTEIISCAASYSLVTLSPIVFYKKIKDAFVSAADADTFKNETLIKLSEEKDETLDALMKEAAGMVIGLKEVDYKKEVTRISKDNHRSKKEKKEQRKTEKL